MRRRYLQLITAAALVVFALTPALLSGQQSPRQLFERARIIEEANQDLMQAIRLYEQAASESKDRPLSAQALLRMAGCYEKLGNNDQARKTYERVASGFGDQKEVAADARRRLTALGNPGGGSQAETITDRALKIEAGLLLSVTPDGRWMGASPKEGIGEIRDLLTNKVALEMPGSDAPLISSDGQTIVFNFFGTDGLRPAGSKTGQLRLMGTASGSKPRILVDSEEIAYYTPLAWSADGSFILTQIKKADNTWQIGWISKSDGAIRVLKSLDWRLLGVHSRPSLSPNGRYIAYSALSKNPSQALRTFPSDSLDQDIYVLSLEDMSEKLLTKGGSINESPIWTPDGNHIVFTSDRTGNFDLYSVAIRDGEAAGFPSLLKKDVGRIRPVNAMTRSGSFYYTVARQSTVLIAEIDPKEVAFRGYGTKLAESFTGLRPVWSPDGDSLAFTKQRPSGEGYDLIVKSLKTGKTKTYPTGDAPYQITQVMQWLRDGSGVLQGPSTTSGLRWYLVDLERGAFSEVTGSGGVFVGLGAFSPDNRVMYVLTPDSIERNPSTREVITRIDRIVPVQIIRSEKDPFQIGFSPDSNTLNRERRQAVNFPDPQRARHGYVVREGVSDFALSPDGHTIALTTWPDPKTGDVYLARINAVDGSGYRKLYGPFRSDTRGHKIRWTRDGRTLLFGKSDANDRWQIMKISAEGGEARSTGLEIERLRNFDLGADGSRVAFEVAPSSPREVRAFDNIPSILATLR